jgi:predicted short-subunit dehydrogenase-like oxidoreductase (DUF2520 family)
MNPSVPRTVRVIGPGRAGTALALALESIGWTVREPVRRGESVAAAAHDVDLLVIATPDSSLAEVAAAVEPVESTVVVHLAGSLGLDVLAPHPERAAVHPLISMPEPAVGARRLAAGAWFAIAGNTPEASAMVASVVDGLGGHRFTVDDRHRAAYHAAASIASNHVVALLGQAERVAATAGVPLVAYLELVRATIENVAELGPSAALTGPAARGDWETIERHRAVLSADELELYDVLVAAARRLVDAPPPSDDDGTAMVDGTER